MRSRIYCCWRMLGKLLTWVAVVVAVEAATLLNVASATQMFYIHWNSSNPMFRIDNTDHIIDVNRGNLRFEYDQVNIICPVYSEDTKDEDTEKYIIYNVSKEEYDTCRITNPSPRVIAVCDKPHKEMYFTITFRSFTPQPGGLEFIAGNDYYFISTSSQDELHRRIGGRCSTHHMKVVFKVCCDPASQPAQDQANNYIPTNGLSTPARGSSTTSTTTTKSTSSTTPKSSSTSTSSSTTFSTTSFKTTSHNTDKDHKVKTSNKIDPNEPDRSDNEVVKNQLKTLNGSNHLMSSWLLIGLLVIFAMSDGLKRLLL